MRLRRQEQAAAAVMQMRSQRAGRSSPKLRRATCSPPTEDHRRATCWGAHHAPSFEDLRRGIDPEWIRHALQVTGTATVRSRRVPAEQVVWLIIGMALVPAL